MTRTVTGQLEILFLCASSKDFCVLADSIFVCTSCTNCLLHLLVSVVQIINKDRMFSIPSTKLSQIPSLLVFYVRIYPVPCLQAGCDRKPIFKQSKVRAFFLDQLPNQGLRTQSTHCWRENRWIYPFAKGIDSKRNTVSSRIWTFNVSSIFYNNVKLDTSLNLCTLFLHCQKMTKPYYQEVPVV